MRHVWLVVQDEVGGAAQHRRHGNGYGIDDDKHPVKVAYPTSFSSAAGLVSTAREVARYSTALHAGQFLSAATRSALET